MSRLTRVSQPIFAGNTTDADQQIAVFGSMKTSAVYTTNLATLMASAEYKEGWADSVVVGYAPFMEELNGVQYGFSYQLAYLQQEGLPEWDGSTTYYQGSLVKLVITGGCQIYASKIDNNTGNLLSDTSSWKLVFDSTVEYATQANLTALQNSAVLLTGNQTIAGTKTFSSSPIAPTPASTDSSTKVATTAFVKSLTNAGPFPKVASRVTVVSSADSTVSSYTPNANGVMYFDQKEGNVTTTITVGGYTMLTMRGHSGSSHGQPSPCATVLVGKGQAVTWTVKTCSAVRFVPFGA